MGKQDDRPARAYPATVAGDDGEPVAVADEGPHADRADVAPEMSQLQNQPHGQAGQPANRPAEEGHQGVTPIQPDSQVQGGRSEVGESPQQAFTHGEPSTVVPTAYTDTGAGDAAPGQPGSGSTSGADTSGVAARDKGPRGGKGQR